MKNLYFISQRKNDAYDTFDAAIVCAESEQEAKNIMPGDFSTWCDPKFVEVEYIGVCKNKNYINGDVVLSSFNAG